MSLCAIRSWHALQIWICATRFFSHDLPAVAMLSYETNSLKLPASAMQLFRLKKLRLKSHMYGHQGFFFMFYFSLCV